MERYFCGIDLGTTNLKVLLCDEAGQVAGHAACPTPRREEGHDILTDPADMMSSIEALLEEAWSKTERRGRIAAIASAGVGEDGFVVGPDLTPRSLSLPWFDRRAKAEAEELARTCDVVERSGIAFEPTRTAAKWLWLARHGKSRVDHGHWVALTDWPLIAWSGRPAMTEALAARTGCWDITEHAWIAEAVRSAEAPPLPPVLPVGAVIGTLRADSFPRRLGAADDSTVVVCGGHDHPTAAAAIRAAHPGAIVDSLGTAELIHAEVPHPVLPAEGLVRTVPAAPGMRGAYLHVFELDRHLSKFAPNDLRAELKGQPGAADISAEIWACLKTASMVSADVLERMEKAGVPSGDLFATGGRARSDRFMQLRANVLGRPIYRVEEGELCALGAAVVAASGIDLAIAPALETQRFLPDPDAAEAFSVERKRRAPEITSLLLHGPR